MKVKKKGGISTVVATIIGIVILTSIFYQYFFMNLDMERYNLINQYARDILLICETMNDIEQNYLLQAKNKLEERITKSDIEYVKMYISVNDETYDVDNMPEHILTDFGDNIEIFIQYYYKPQRISFEKGIIPKKSDDNMEIMGVRLSTISKNRGTSDG